MFLQRKLYEAADQTMMPSCEDHYSMNEFKRTKKKTPHRKDKSVGELNIVIKIIWPLQKMESTRPQFLY